MTDGAPQTQTRLHSKNQNWAMRILKFVVELFVWTSVAFFFVWAIGALYFLSYVPQPIRTGLAIAFPVVVFYSLGRHLLQRRKSDTGQSLRWLRMWLIVSIGVIYLLTLLIRPSNDRQWDPDQARVADVSIDAGRVTIENFRNNVYRSDSEYDTHFETQSFPLERIESVSLLVQRFTAKDGLGHLFLSFGLQPSEQNEYPDYVSVSVEIRRELGETYSPTRGIYRSYELTHVMGDERDLIGVRTVHRPVDRVYLYPINATPEQAQQMFVNFAQRIEKLKTSPRFYHTLLNNCANGITQLTYELTPEPINWLDPRIVLPGYAGKFAFEKGLVGDAGGGQTFEQLQEASRIDEIARRVGITESFSRDIRKSLESNQPSGR